MLDELGPWVVLGLALALVPSYAFPSASVPRGTSADVVEGEAYVEATSLSPVLNASNGYQADAVTVEHQHGSSVTLDVNVSNAALDPRFVFPDVSVALEPGGQASFLIEDGSQMKEPGSYLLTATVEAITLQDGRSVGYQTVQVSLTVMVEDS